MRYSEIAPYDKEVLHILESASGGATGAGAIASVSGPVGGVIKRMPTTPNLFGYVPSAPPKTKKKRPKSK